VGIDNTAEAEGYREGRIDEERHLQREGRVRPTGAVVDDTVGPRRVVRVRRRGSPLLALLVLIAVVFAGVMIYLAVQNGSFSSGGAVLDNSLAKAKDSVQAPIDNARERTGEALEKAGRDIK
jgi:flagellin-like protein